jgi:ribonuclease HI
MVITINTDASFSNKHRIGAFACWVVSNRFKIKFGGMLKKKCESPTHAECMAIINALHMVFLNDMTGVKMIIVNTDSMNSKHIFENDTQAIKRYRLKSYSQQFYGRFVKMKMDAFRHNQKVEFQFRHVKAHQDTDTPRTYINDWCDCEAKRHMGHALDQFKEKQPT